MAGWFDDDGRYHLRGELDPDHGRIVDAALTEARDALFQAGQPKVSWADALVEMAQRSLDGASLRRRERFRVNWFIDPTDPIPARFTDGLAVPDWLRDLLLCDGTVSPVFTDNGLPVSVGRTQYAGARPHPPPRARTGTASVGCRGATRPAGCRSITSSTTNITVRPTPGTWPGCARPVTGCIIKANSASPATPTSPTGSPSPTPTADVIDPATRPIKPTGPPPAGPVKPYEHPLGERLQRWAILFPDPPPDHVA